MTRQYIGARYVPRFRGEYDNTVQYEGLDVVDNGVGTTYIARKIVPAGTPLTNTEYWFVYGASSGAILDLQTRMTAAENDIDDIELKLGDYFTPEDYGAVGDGVTDDTQAFVDMFTAALAVDGSTMVMAKNYYINALTLDAEVSHAYTPHNFIVLGSLTVANKITFKHFSRSNIIIRLNGGGTNNVNDVNCMFYEMQESTLNLKAIGVSSTAFQIRKSNWMNVKLIGNGNKRLLLHGETGESQSAFGAYEFIYDVHSDYPIRFEASNDITVMHFEGIFVDESYTRYALEIINTHAINFTSLATGGKCKNVVYVKDSHMNVGYAFLTNENYTTPRNSDAFELEGNAILTVGTIRAGNMKSLFYVHDIVDTPYPARLECGDYWMEKADYGNTLISRGTYTNMRVIIAGDPIEVSGITAGTNTDITYVKTYIDGKDLVITGALVISSNAANYEELIKTIPRTAVYRVNGLITNYNGTPYPVYVEKNNNSLCAGAAIPSGNYYITIRIPYALNQ